MNDNKILSFEKAAIAKREAKVAEALATLATPTVAPFYAEMPKDVAGIQILEAVLADMRVGKIAGVTIQMWDRDSEGFGRATTLPPEFATRPDNHFLRVLGFQTIVKEDLLALITGPTPAEVRS